MATTQSALPVIDFSLIGPRIGERLPEIVLPDQRGRLVDIHAARACTARECFPPGEVALDLLLKGLERVPA